MVTGLYAAIFALAQIVLTVAIVRLRFKHKVSLGDGNHHDLATRIRVHGNFTETVPMALILMGIAEFSGAPLWAVHALGVMMILSRFSHAFGLLIPPGYGLLRKVGMALTFAVYIIGGALCIFYMLRGQIPILG